MPCLSLFRIILSISGSSAASVLPEPVGAITRTLSPWAMRGMASICGGVGVEIPVSSSSSLSGAESSANASETNEATDQFLESENSKINFLGDQKYGLLTYFFSVIFFKKYL